MTQHVQWSLETFFNEDPSRGELRFQSRRLLSQLLGNFQHDHQAQYLIDSRCRSGRPRRPVAFARNVTGDTQRWPLLPVRRRLSISHVSQCIAAAVSNHRVGIDVIDNEIELPRGFSRMWFDEQERGVMGDFPLHAFWAAKEASYKAHCRRDSFRPSQWKIAAARESAYDPDVLHCHVTQRSDSRPQRIAYVSILRRTKFMVALATVTANPVLEEQTFPSTILQLASKHHD